MQLLRSKQLYSSIPVILITRGSYTVVAKQATVFLYTCNFLEDEPNSFPSIR